MKYKLTNETKQWLGRTLHRIQATEDFGNVKAGDLGGWIETEGNLSQDGTAVIRDDAVVCDRAVIRDYAWIGGHAVIRDDAEVSGHAWIDGHAVIRDYAWIGGHAVIGNDAWIGGSTCVDGCTVIGSNAYITKTTDYITISPIDSRYDYVTFYRTRGGGISVTYDDFEGSIHEFAAHVTETHGNNKYAQMYKLAIEMAKLQILGDD